MVVVPLVANARCTGNCHYCRCLQTTCGQAADAQGVLAQEGEVCHLQAWGDRGDAPGIRQLAVAALRRISILLGRRRLGRGHLACLGGASLDGKRGIAARSSPAQHAGGEAGRLFLCFDREPYDQRRDRMHELSHSRAQGLVRLPGLTLRAHPSPHHAQA